MADAGDDVFFASIPELNARLRSGDTSAVELTRAFSERLERLGPKYNALALPLTEHAIRRAREVDKEIKRERLRGPLQGIPFGAKDLLSYAGQPTTWGARPYAAQVFNYTATVLEKLDDVGSVLIGKLAMIELAGGGGYRYARASLTGAALNPWDRTRWAGGSSSGSGAAVAAGLVPFALGSETSGSVLTPSAFCGITGLRPTYGLVSRYGAMSLSWTMDKIGPMCRSAEDCALVLQVIAGGDNKDPGSAGKSFYYTPQFARKMSDLRAGFAPADFSEWTDPAARPAFEQALKVMRDAGLQFVETKMPDLPFGSLADVVISAEGSAVFEELIQSGQVNQLADQAQIAGLKAGLEISSKDYLKAMRVRSLAQHAFRRMFSDIDVIVAPALYSPAPKVSERLDQEDTPNPEPKDRGFSALVPAGNLAGLPALCLPCGFANNLPVALQLVGRPFSENTLVGIGKDFQSRTDWHRRKPPLS